MSTGNRFNSVNFFLPLDDTQNDIWNSTAKDLRFAVPVSQLVTIGMEYENNAPGLAHTYLGDVTLWWVILEFNGLSDAMTDLTPGLQIRIPDRKSLIAYLERDLTPTSSETTLTI